uniref:properdin-like isoform X2 n=1 Tax=Pristiophorus japonicus TaxID=55135 RepID=UPI00398EA3DA
MGDPALVLSTLCLLATSAGATVGRCFSGVNTRLGVCTDLIGDGIEEHDCCLNINYCFQAGHNGNSQPCRHAAEWTDWSAWSGCTVSCREGVQQRRRRCYGKGSCRGDEVLQTRPCTDRDCCIDNGGWSGWAGWSACSVTCASGQQQRQRTCSQPPPSCGGQCPGSGLEHRHCDTQQICPIHGSWSLWGSWTACGQSCRQERSRLVPVRRRTRVCNSPAPSTFPPGNSCTGGSMDTNQCNFLPFCPVAGNWGSWSAVSLCSTTCGIGKIQQQRRCDSPAPKHGGTACPGNANSNIHCNTKIACPGTRRTVRCISGESHSTSVTSFRGSSRRCRTAYRATMFQTASEAGPARWRTLRWQSLFPQPPPSPLAAISTSQVVVNR